MWCEGLTGNQFKLVGFLDANEVEKVIRVYNMLPQSSICKLGLIVLSLKVNEKAKKWGELKGEKVWRCRWMIVMCSRIGIIVLENITPENGAWDSIYYPANICSCHWLGITKSWKSSYSICPSPVEVSRSSTGIEVSIRNAEIFGLYKNRLFLGPPEVCKFL